MYKEIFNQPFFENSNRHMNEGLTVNRYIGKSIIVPENTSHEDIYKRLKCQYNDIKKDVKI